LLKPLNIVQCGSLVGLFNERLESTSFSSVGFGKLSNTSTFAQFLFGAASSEAQSGGEVKEIEWEEQRFARTEQVARHVFNT